jgi:hypothetical protein
MNTKTIAPHITAFLSGLGATIALIHPGFTVPPFVQGLVTTVCVLASTVVEITHFVKKHQLAAAAHFAATVVAQQTAPKA